MNDSLFIWHENSRARIPAQGGGGSFPEPAAGNRAYNLTESVISVFWFYAVAVSISQGGLPLKTTFLFKIKFNNNKKKK